MPGFNLTGLDLDGMCGERYIPNAGPLNNIETARNHRYSLEILPPFGNKEEGIILYVEKCTRPTPEFDEVVIHSGQDEIYRPGKMKWNPIEFTFYEKVAGKPENFYNQTTALIYKWWAKNMYKDSRAIHPRYYYNNAQLIMLDGRGYSIWTYYLYQCWIQKVSSSELSYHDSDIATTSVILRFNKAEEKQE